MAVQPIRLLVIRLRTPPRRSGPSTKGCAGWSGPHRDLIDAPGAGLAAPQIGVSLRVFTYWVDDEPGHLVNPDLDLSDELQIGDEGCLSLPDLAFETPRSLRVVAKGMNMHGEPVVIEGSDLLARAVQHETDHLDGILFIDRLDPEARKEAMRMIRASEWFGEATPTIQASPHAISSRWL
jgi:peptide deformylase